MHNTLPDDPRYPYSQPRSYVHKANVDPGTLAFLGFVTSSTGQEAVQSAKAAVETASKPEAAPSPSQSTAAVSPSPTASASASPESAAAPTESVKVLPWWLWLFPLALLGGLLWWLLRRGQRQPAATSAAPAGDAVGTATVTGAGAAAIAERSLDSRIVLVPRNCREAYAYWEVSEAQKAALRQQGGRKLALRLYDVTDIDMERQTPHSVKQFDCNESEPDLHVPVAVDDRDYVAELGYIGTDDRWLQIAKSAHIRVPACTPTGDVITGDTVLAGGVALASGNGISSVPVADAAPVADAGLPETTAPVADTGLPETTAPVTAIPKDYGDYLGGAALGRRSIGSRSIGGDNKPGICDGRFSVTTAT